MSVTALSPSSGSVSQSRAVGAAAVAVLSWSTVAAAFKTALNYFSVFEMVTVASTAAAIIFAIAVTLRRRWQSLATLSRRDLAMLAVLGLFNPAAYYLILFAAYDLLPAQVAQPINYCWPIFLTILLAVVLKRPVRPRLYAGMAVSLAGVACISLGGGGLPEGTLSVSGILLAFASAALWAVYWILNERLRDGIDESVKLMVSFAFASLVLIAAIPFVPSATFAPPQGWWASIYIGAFEMGVPFLFFSIALRLASNVAIVNQMCYISPFLSLFFISLVVGETIVPLTFVGLALIVGGVAFNRYISDK